MPQIKYRAACDHCSATKIKCTQERPQCARCRALGRDCHYSRSLRAGKPLRSSQGLNRKLSNAPVLPRHDSIPEVQVSVTKAEQAWSATAGPYPTPPAMVPTNSPDVFQFPEVHHGDSSSSSASPTAHPEWFFDFNQGSGMISGLPMNHSHSAPRGSVSSPGTHVSGNLDPLVQWRAGGHFAAVNWQDFDKGMQLNEALFVGTPGWVVKPDGMMERGIVDRAKDIMGGNTSRLSVEIIGISARKKK